MGVLARKLTPVPHPQTSKVGKDKAAWAKTDEYLTNLMDSDTVLTLENTDEDIKRAQNYMQRQDNDGEKHVAISSASDESNDGEEVKTLRAALKEKDQRLSALEVKFDSFSNEQKDGSNKRKKPVRKNEKACTYCKKGWQVVPRTRRIRMPSREKG